MRTNSQKHSSSRKQAERATILHDESTLKNSVLFNGTTFCIPTLTLLSGDALGKELPLLQQQVTLGRGEGSDVLILDPSVSRRHIQLSCRKLIAEGERQDLRVVLRDLGSKQGTMVNHRRVRRAVLKPGDKIFIGRIVLKFEYKTLADQKFFDQIYRLVTTDSLTGLMNRAAILRVLQEETAKQKRYRRMLSVVLVDIDNFRSLNDTFGQTAGDRVLQAISGVMRRRMRVQDRGGRMGGDEFLLVLSETGFEGAGALAERLRAEIEDAVWRDVQLGHRLTASFGVASCSIPGSNAEKLVERAHSALNRAKRLGKNRIELWKKDEFPVCEED